MLSVANVRQRSARVTRGLFVLLAVGLFGVLSVSIPAYATGTTIYTEVRDSQPVSLTVTTDIEGRVSTLPTVVIDGAVHNVTQIIVYVDNIFNTSLPLPTGARTYSVSFGVTPGTHEVRITGLDAYTNTEVNHTVHFAYEPGASSGATDGTDTTSPVDGYISDTIDAAKATQAEATQQVQRASSSGPLGALSDLAFNTFKSLDLVSTTDGTGINKMAGRFTLVSAGIVATVFPWSAYGAIEKLRFIPKLSVSGGVLANSIRAMGLILVLIPFILIH